jgi:hypothetical protein
LSKNDSLSALFIKNNRIYHISAFRRHLTEQEKRGLLNGSRRLGLEGNQPDSLGFGEGVAESVNPT